MIRGHNLTEDFKWCVVQMVGIIVDYVRRCVHVFIMAKRAIIKVSFHS